VIVAMAGGSNEHKAIAGRFAGLFAEGRLLVDRVDMT
jgi:hypothetical protein